MLQLRYKCEEIYYLVMSRRQQNDESPNMIVRLRDWININDIVSSRVGRLLRQGRQVSLEMFT